VGCIPGVYPGEACYTYLFLQKHSCLKCWSGAMQHLRDGEVYGVAEGALVGPSLSL